jgi:radical SAM protein with 4Fe4S-binding SPASM domain
MKSIVIVQEADYFTRHYCGACGFNMVVSPDGRISTCVEVLSDANPGASELLVGKWVPERHDIEMDWDKMGRLRDRMDSLDDDCKSCTFRTNCAGNCLVRAARNRGTVMKADPEACAMTKAALSRFLTEMADGRLVNHLMYRVEDAR